MYSKSTCFKYYMNSGILIRSCFSKAFNLARNDGRQHRVVSFCGHSLYRPLYIVPKKSVQEREHKLLVIRNSSLTAMEPNTIDDDFIDHQLLEEISSRSAVDLGYVSFTPVVDHLYDSNCTKVSFSVQRLDFNHGKTLLMAGPLATNFPNPQVCNDVIYSALPLQTYLIKPLLLTGKDNSQQHEERSEQPEKASETQLLAVKDYLCDSFANFFTSVQSFSVYRKDIEFQNNIKCVTTKGITAYMIQMYLLKFYGHLHYARVKVDILKITHHTEDCTVRVRWRVDGISRRKLVFHLHRFKNKNWEEFLQDQSEWLDGFSVFSVDRDGLIFKHVCDKMIPDDEELALKPMSFRSRLLTILGLTSRPSVGGMHNVTSCNTFRAFKQPRKTVHVT